MSLIHKTLRITNWIIVILLICLGIVLSIEILDTAIVLVIVGVLISPYASDLMRKIGVTVSYQTKMILVLLGLVTIAFSINQGSNEQVGLKIASGFLDYENDERFKAFVQNQEKKERVSDLENTFQANRNKQVAQLRTLYNNGNYQEVVTQGTPYIEFDATVKKLVEDAQIFIDQQQIEKALLEAPQLQKDGKFYEVYLLTHKFIDIPELKKLADDANNQREELFKALKLLYEKGKYDEVIRQGITLVEFDCRINGLVTAAKQAKDKKEELERNDKVRKSAYRLLRDRQFDKAYDLTKDFKDPDLQEVTRVAKEELDKIAEKRILAKLKSISAAHIPQQIEEYAKLVALFPDNPEYKDKLKYYRDKMATTKHESRYIVSQTEYGNKWPFKVSQGLLKCDPPGIVTFWANERTYGLNELASSRGYAKITDILVSPNADTLSIISKGLKLCQ